MMIPGPTRSLEQALIQRRKVLGPAYRLFYDEPLALSRGEDVWLFDVEGRRYLDAYNNVPVVGHGHPRVVEALARQASTLNTHTRYLHDAVLTYAERLVEKFPSTLDTAMFTCTGSEANDLALRIARAATGATGVIVTSNAYHGVTAALADFSPSLQPVAAHVRTVAPPRLVAGAQEGSVGERFGADVQAAVIDLAKAGLKPALLIVDSVFASDGIFAVSPGDLTAAVEIVRSAGGLYVADEVQAGFCRLGRGWWGFERSGLVPDLVTLGKPMGNGHPMGGVVMSAGLARAFAAKGRYFNTFGGNPVSAVVGSAVLDVIESESLLDRTEKTGAYLQQSLQELARGHETVAEVRGVGLYFGVELAGREARNETGATVAAYVVNRLRSLGVLINASGPRANVLKIRPPLTFAREHADQLVQALDQALSELA